MSVKAAPTDFLGRFREIISDPLNLLIERHPLAGVVDSTMVHLHNGHNVPLCGKHAYYNQFSHILVLNRGVHEPLEEYVFQEVLKVLPESPLMLELGAYWGHYSMWLKKAAPKSSVYLVHDESTPVVTSFTFFGTRITIPFDKENEIIPPIGGQKSITHICMRIIQIVAVLRGHATSKYFLMRCVVLKLAPMASS